MVKAKVMPGDTRLPPFWISPAILAAAAAYLAKRWDELPARWVVHWGAGGRPNGWASPSFQGVYGVLVIGLVMWMAFEAIVVGLAVQARLLGTTEAGNTATRAFLRWVSISLSLAVSFLAVQLPFGDGRSGPSVVVVLALLGGGILVGMVHGMTAARRAQEAGAPAATGYHGVYYANREDRRLFVPKRYGLGYTINFSHPWAWPALLLLIGVPVGLVILVTRMNH
jgi:uncharacterized membrane protein